MASSLIGLRGLKKEICRTQCFLRFALRQLTTQVDLEVKSNNNEIAGKKRFASYRRTRELKPMEDNIAGDLFVRVIDKKVFKYPSVLENTEIDSLLRHSIEVENYLQKLPMDILRINSHVLKELKNLEVFGLTIPEKYGGLGYTETESKFIQECLCINPIMGNFIGCNENFGIKILTLYGSEEQKLKYLPKLASGESIISFAYLEDSALVELKSQNTTCYFDEERNSYVVTGKKKWVHNANIADLIIVLTKKITFKDHFGINLLHFLLIEKNSPGVTVQECKYGNTIGFNVCEVELNEVLVPKDNLIGSDLQCVYPNLKHVLSFGQLSSSIACLSTIKKICHSAIEYSKEKTLDGSPLKECGDVKHDIGYLTVYSYVLESIAYFVSGRFDTYQNPDLFLETNIAKALGVELLDLSIKRYLEILGIDSYTNDKILREALKVLQLYSVLDESQIQLKLMIGSTGIVYACQSSNEFRQRIEKQRHPYNYPFEAIFFLFSNMDSKVKKLMPLYNLKTEVHQLLKYEVKILEECLIKLGLSVENLLCRFGNCAVKHEIYVMNVAEMEMYVYALLVCIIRASSSLPKNAENTSLELNIVKCFAKQVNMIIETLFTSVTHFNDINDYYNYIGKITFDNKNYPVQHPLSRNY